jgi:hypothetical protein
MEKLACPKLLVHYIGVEMVKSFNLFRGRNCYTLLLIIREVQIWDVKKLQIQSELFLPSSQDIQGIAVDGHRGILYTLTPRGVRSLIIITYFQ